MESFISRRPARELASSSPPLPQKQETQSTQPQALNVADLEDTTDVKLATLSSLLPTIDQATLLDLLISTDGSVEKVLSSLSGHNEVTSPRKKRSATSVGYQTSLAAFRKPESLDPGLPSAKRRVLTKKGQTLHLYSAEDIAAHTPCSIIHNFLPAKEAEDLLRELLQEAPTFERQTFKLFDNVVQSPHSACFYVESLEERERQRTQYLYNGSYLNVGLRSLSFVEIDGFKWLATNSSGRRIYARSHPRCGPFPPKYSQLSTKRSLNGSNLTIQMVKNSSINHHRNGFPTQLSSIAMKAVKKV